MRASLDCDGPRARVESSGVVARLSAHSASFARARAPPAHTPPPHTCLYPPRTSKPHGMRVLRRDLLAQPLRVQAPGAQAAQGAEVPVHLCARARTAVALDAVRVRHRGVRDLAHIKHSKLSVCPLARAAPTWPGSGQLWPKSGQTWPMMVKCWPKLAKFGPNLAEGAPDLTELGPDMANFGPNDFGLSLADLGQTCSRWDKCGRFRAKFGRVRANLDTNSADIVDVLPVPVRRGRCWSSSFQIWATSTNFDQCRPHLGRVGPGFVQIWAISTGGGPTWAKHRLHVENLHGPRSATLLSKAV